MQLQPELIFLAVLAINVISKPAIAKIVTLENSITAGAAKVRPVAKVVTAIVVLQQAIGPEAIPIALAPLGSEIEANEVTFLFFGKVCIWLA